jgi:threonine aldolase
MGGGWRQSGLMASMAQYAIEQIFLKRDSEGKSLMQRDHENAKWLSHQLVSRWPGLRIVNPVHTNMLFCDVREMFISLDQTASESDWLSVEELVATVNQLIFERTNGSVVRLPAWGYTFDRGDGRGNVDDTYVMRLVLHYQIDREGCRLLLDYLEQAGNLIKKKKNK